MRRWSSRQAARERRAQEKQDMHRMLVLVWELGEGKVGASVGQEEIEARWEALSDMPEAEFREYEKRVFEKYPMVTN